MADPDSYAQESNSWTFDPTRLSRLWTLKSGSFVETNLERDSLRISFTTLTTLSNLIQRLIASISEAFPGGTINNNSKEITTAAAVFSRAFTAVGADSNLSDVRDLIVALNIPIVDFSSLTECAVGIWNTFLQSQVDFECAVESIENFKDWFAHPRLRRLARLIASLRREVEEAKKLTDQFQNVLEKTIGGIQLPGPPEQPAPASISALRKAILKNAVEQVQGDPEQPDNEEET
jgi:hypothetical protein